MMKTVRFVFSENDRETASRIAGELSQQFGTYNSDDDNKDLTFSSDNGIFEDSAVVIISLQAIDDEKWKKEKINTQFINFAKLKDYYDFGGIRLEDDVLITKTGNRLLGSKRLPITVKEVEAAMKG